MKIIPRALCLIVFLVFASAARAQENNYVRTKLISMPEYILSDADRDAGIDGKLSLMVRVDKTGKVKNAEVWSGPYWPCDKRLDDSIKRVRDDVKKTMMAARFEAATQNSKPRETEILMTFIVRKTYEKKKTSDAAKAVANDSLVVVDAGNLNAKAKYISRPEYPNGARGVSIVSVFVVVNEQGSVIIAGSSSGGSEIAFGDSARTAACKAKFLPTLVDGSPIRVSGVLTYNFGLTVR